MQNMIIALCEANEYSSAKEICFHLVLDLNTMNNTNMKYHVYTNLADIYMNTGKLDSSSFYIDKATELIPEINNNMELASFYHLCYLIEKEKNNDKKALFFHENYMFFEKNHFENNASEEMLGIERKYNYIKLIIANNQLIMGRQRHIIIGITILLISLIMLIYILKKRQQYKLEKEKSENDMLFLKQLIDDNEKSLRSVVFEKIDFVKQVASLEKFKNKDIRIAETKKVINAINPELIIETINRIDKDYLMKFKNKYTQLEYIEVIICLMLLFEFENNEIAVLLNFSSNTIQQKEVEIRKKIGVKPRGNIKQFIEEDFRQFPK